jgi:hypothetical protein
VSGRDAIRHDSGDPVARRLGRQLPHLLSQGHDRGTGPTVDRGHIAQHQYHDGIVGKDVAHRGEYLAQETRVCSRTGGRSGIAIHLGRIVAQEPEAKPVV